MSLLQELALRAKSTISFDEEVFALPTMTEMIESFASKVLLTSDDDYQYDQWPEKSLHTISNWLSLTQKSNHPALQQSNEEAASEPSDQTSNDSTAEQTVQTKEDNTDETEQTGQVDQAEQTEQN